ncbi:CotO family spore coat protein [Gracilibacillus alcaliphilus]|uniref:CotO family spore coat protein n=1 Tax=Gracilibacillus alcaliphilus TaxID=1401441 RepID=UPI0019591977|nr:CotO family spore coat protein [Gracilibacillus alcaliphilus]MBM7675487.1 hypothetical protein [Gracilibacillus alcaliphilus]
MSFIKEDKECPKLYITQPDFSKPTRRMQTVYQSNRQAEKPAADTELAVPNTKKVTEMTLEEKVRYFAAKPSHLPKARCRITTEKRTYLGLIQHYQNEMVTIKVSSKTTPVTIPFNQIEAIDIVGF